MNTVVLDDNQLTVVIMLAIFLWCGGWVLSAVLHTSQQEDKTTVFDFVAGLTGAASLLVMLVTLFVIAFGS